uniref:Uncharacterized protein n=1 Tax=viral metagenome TaxID=1070528 RepID=A0A6C0CPH8_9ZZZZ
MDDVEKICIGIIGSLSFVCLITFFVEFYPEVKKCFLKNNNKNVKLHPIVNNDTEEINLI